MKLRRFFAGLAVAAGIWASCQTAQATMFLPVSGLDQRVNFVGKDGLIVEGTVADAKMVTLDKPAGWVATECTIQGTVVKGSNTFGYQASDNPQEVKVRIFGYGNVGIKGLPTCDKGDQGLFFFYGKHPVTGLSSFAYGPQGKFIYQQVDGQTLAFDGYKNMTLNLKSLQNPSNKALGVNAKFLSGVKALAVDSNDPSKGLHADMLKSVVSEMVKAYYSPVITAPTTATSNQSPH